MNKKNFTKTDFKLIIFFLCVASFIYIFFIVTNKKSELLYAEIIHKGNVIKKVDLNYNTTFSVAEKPNIVFEVKDNAIRFVSSDCPDKLCVKTGFVEEPWQVCACLPNDVIIKIISDR